LGDGHFCASEGSRETCPRSRMKGRLPHPTIRSLAAALADAAPSPPVAGCSSDEAPTRQARWSTSSAERLQLLFFPRILPTLLRSPQPGLPVISAGCGVSRFYRRVGPMRSCGFSHCVHPSDSWRMDAHRPGIARADPSLESGIRPLLDRQDLDPVESVRPLFNRFAPVRALSEALGRKKSGERRDLLPACAGVHRSAHYRRRTVIRKESFFSATGHKPGGIEDRSASPWPRRFHRREDRARHQHCR